MCNYMHYIQNMQKYAKKIYFYIYKYNIINYLTKNKPNRGHIWQPINFGLKEKNMQMHRNPSPSS
jgi:hypothetical protein